MHHSICRWSNPYVICFSVYFLRSRIFFFINIASSNVRNLSLMYYYHEIHSLYSNGVNEVIVAQSFPTLWDPMDCSPPGFSVHGILHTRILEWVAIHFSRGSSQPRDQTRVSCIAGRFFTIWTTRDAPINSNRQIPDLKIQSAGNRKNHHHKWKNNC